MPTGVFSTPKGPASAKPTAAAAVKPSNPGYPAPHQQLDLSQAQGSAAAAVMGGSARLSPAGAASFGEVVPQPANRSNCSTTVLPAVRGHPIAVLQMLPLW